MKPNYKYAISRKKISGVKEKSSKPFFIFLVILLIPATWVSYGFYNLHIARNELHKNSLSDTYSHLMKASVTGISPTRSATGIFLIKLLSGNLEQIETISDYPGELDLEYYDTRKIFQLLIENRRHREILALGEYLKHKYNDATGYYYTGIEYLSRGALEKAAENFFKIIDHPEYSLLAEKQLFLIEEIMNNPRFSGLRDRYDEPIFISPFSKNSDDESTESLKFLTDYFNKDKVNRLGFIKTTIDKRIQLVAEKLLGSKSGIITVVEPNSGDILAAAASGEGAKKNFLTRHIEPGILLNIPVLIAVLNKKSTDSIQPNESQKSTYDAEGIDSGSIEKIEQNLIKNIKQRILNNSFDIVNRIGSDHLAETFQSLGYNTRFNKELIAHVDLDIIKDSNNGSFLDLYSTAWTSPLHLALLASVFVCDGEFHLPELLINKRDLEGNILVEAKPSNTKRITSPVNATLIRSLFNNYTITNNEGKKLQWYGLSIFSGGIRSHFTSLLIGFCSSEKTVLAFSLILFDNTNQNNDMESIINELILKTNEMDFKQ